MTLFTWVLFALVMTALVVSKSKERARHRRIDSFDVPPAVPYDGSLRPLLTPADRDRRTAELEANLATPIEDVIAAAEYRAEHPNEPEPKILADLADEPPSGLLAMPAMTSEQAEEVAQRFKASNRCPASIVPPGMEYRTIPVIPQGRHAVLVDADSAPSRPVDTPITTRTVKRPANPYAGCRHPDADREEIRSLGSSAPVKVVVTECPMCDRVALLRTALADVVAEMGALLSGWEKDHGLGAYKLPQADLVRYRKLRREGEAIRGEINRAAEQEMQRSVARAFRVGAIRP
jgi:hypothetical protein